MFGVPFLFVSWLMLLCMAFSMFGKAVKTAWLLVHAAVFLLLLLGAWLASRLVQTESGSPIANLGLIEAAALIVVELLYFSAFLVFVVRFGAGSDGDKRRVLLRFAALVFGGVRGAFAARGPRPRGRPFGRGRALGLLRLQPAGAALSTSERRSGVPARQGRASEQARHGACVRALRVTKRERQIVQKICLGKTNQQIADELFISLQTVKDHTHRIYSKIGINSRMQLVQMMNVAK